MSNRVPGEISHLLYRYNDFVYPMVCLKGKNMNLISLDPSYEIILISIRGKE